MILGQRYEIQDQIGRGLTAAVYRGRDLRMDRVVAIKVLREGYNTDDSEFGMRWKLAMRMVLSIHHPNIVQVYDYVEAPENSFVVMELVEGTDLQRHFREQHLLPIEMALFIVKRVADGLQALHQHSLVYNALSPKKVLLSNTGQVKLALPGGMFDQRYMAPDRIGIGQVAMPATDIYALGCVLYAMLTGHPPFDGDTPVAMAMQHIQDAPIPPSKLNSAIPAKLEEIILRCLEKQPEMRYRDGNALAQALEACY